MLSRCGTGTDHPPPSGCYPVDVAQAWTLCALLRPSAGFSARHGISKPRTACARPGWLCGAVRAYKHIDIKEPRQAVNLSGVSCVITNASGGGCGASSSLQAAAPLRGCTWVYYTVASLPGSYNSPVHNGAGFRTLEALKCCGCLACYGF